MMEIDLHGSAFAGVKRGAPVTVGHPAFGAPHLGTGPVLARGHGGHGHGNGGQGHHHHHGNGHKHHHHGYGGAVFAYFGDPFYSGIYNTYAYDDGCYRLVRVLTRHHGWRWRPVNVCYYGN
ncbi:hypothetical protein [Pseudorhodoplanes sinuspersici]|uniref:Uncharacterized protein n=1 Tax=Pseudorhodoplanes sinuspersici TaxID=1235591 RepID=A0A1W6ZTX5_9HYPH|nr:hypothetical protein [Pseudorhodoplanes sinuspersici]ARQ00834.1 hypothetical protein CAK95_18375 [Pseudorhodoplanes sinuspersici]